MANVRGLPQILISQELSSILCLAPGLLPSEAWTLWGPSLKQQEIEGDCWSTLITSPSGLKLSPCQISEMWMPRDLYGKILSLSLGSLTPSSRTMVFNLIANPLGGIVVIWAFRIGTPPWLIYRGMDKPRLLIKS